MKLNKIQKSTIKLLLDTLKYDFIRNEEDYNMKNFIDIKEKINYYNENEYDISELYKFVNMNKKYFKKNTVFYYLYENLYAILYENKNYKF